MTQENKELLLKDLAARLSYGVKVYNTTFKEPTIQTLYGKISDYEFLMEETYTSVGIDGDDFGSFNKRHYTGYVDFIKPYLRPMSSMTENEKKEIAIAFNSKWSHANEMDITSDELWKSGREPLGFMAIRYIDMDNVIKYLNAHHLDYRCLIEKGLAIDCTNLNIY